MSQWFGFPMIASEHGLQVDFFILFLHVIMIIGFVGWGAWYVAALWRFRSGRHPTADYHGIRSGLPFVLVALLAMAEGLLLIIFAIPFWHDEIAAAPAPDEGDQYRVRVIAQQFQWNIHYPGEDGVFGRTAPDLVDDVTNPIGLDDEDPASEDDITTINQLRIPVGEEVLIQLTTKDVIHSFFLPEFRIKQDAVPGMRIPIYFTPTMSSAEFKERSGDAEREFQIACAQLCGNSHYTMRGFVYVEPREDVEAWYTEKLEEKREFAEDDWFFNDD